MSFAQEEFHVFPKAHHETPGTETGTGSISNPWDLQTALSQSSEIVNSGDIIWLHKGIYNGRYVSTLESLEEGKYITVSAYKNDKVVLNGNVTSSYQNVLHVKGKQVIYKNFEITYLGEYSRNVKDDDFELITGLEHTSGEDCKFINLRIYNNPGIGIGSWKHTGGTVIDGCIIYNNGFINKNGDGGGEGIYTQNSSDKIRVIQNCIIFNNYYKNIEVWSANKKADREYVKNYNINNNVIFNSGNPAQLFKDNLIIASGDNNGINIAKNIKVESNIFYHNTDVKNAEVNGDAACLTIGFNKNAPVEHVSVKDNIIIGRNNALRLLYAKSLTFERNRIYTGYVVLQSDELEYISNWKFSNNHYYTKKSSSFRIVGDKDYNLERWQSQFGIDDGSTWKKVKQFDMTSLVNIKTYEHKPNTYKVVVFKEDESDAIIDFSEFNINTGVAYKIYDVENLNVIAKSGHLSEDFQITVPMQLSGFEKPLHNTLAQKSLSNFGVFIIEFEDQKVTQEPEKKDNFFKRFFKWLGF